MKNIQEIFTSWTVIVLLILSAGCGAIGPEDSDKELVAIKTIGVLPASIDSHQPQDTQTMGNLRTGAETINAFLSDYFQSRANVSLISQNELEGLSYADSNRPFYLAREAGEKLHYDAVLVPSVSRYRERDGSEYAVINPAAVAFSLKILAVESGQVIWSADFDQAQQPLLDNILPKTRSTGSGFRWLTAAELTSAGLNKKLASCPYLQKD